MRAFVLAAVLLVVALPASAQPAPKVLVSIKPIHSIVAVVMERGGTPELLLTGAASPHSYALKPSDAEKIWDSDVIFWVGPVLENFLATPLANLAPRARKVALLDSPGVKVRPARKGGPWDADPDEGESGIDGHIWLDPDNGIAIARAVAQALSSADPSRARLYADNAEAFAQRLRQLDAQIARRLAPVRTRPYIVFHDAYRYFEDHYGLKPVGSVTVASDRPPGTRRIETIHSRIKSTNVACVFSTAQFSPRLVAALIEGTSVNSAPLDDLGAGIAPGPNAYERLLSSIAETVVSCLGR
jgi:zinc transport system substrate-binding protein